MLVVIFRTWAACGRASEIGKRVKFATREVGDTRRKESSAISEENEGLDVV